MLITLNDTIHEGKRKHYGPLWPKFAPDSAKWIEEFSKNKDDIFWQDNVECSYSLPHIIYMIENCNIHSSVLNGIINHYGADEDCLLTLCLQHDVPMREYIHERKPGEEFLDSINERSKNITVEYDINDKNLFKRLNKGEIQIVREFVYEAKKKVLDKFYKEREYVFKTIKRCQKIHPFTDMFICWFYAAGYMDFSAFQIFYDIDEEFPPRFKDLIESVSYDEDDE